MLKLFKLWKNRNNLEWMIANGYAERGRVGMGGSIIKVTNKLVAKHIRNGEVIGERVVENKKVTTAFVNFIVAQLQTESSIFGDFKYHDSGTSSQGEAPGDTGLITPCGEARTTGTQIEGAQTYEYKSVATHTYAGGFAIVEHGLFNAATGVTLMDRTVFSVINVVASDKIEFTFTIQFSAEA